jgi:hypothetical protein
VAQVVTIRRAERSVIVIIAAIPPPDTTPKDPALHGPATTRPAAGPGHFRGNFSRFLAAKRFVSATSNMKASASEVLHQRVQRIHDGRTRFGSQVRVDWSCPGAAMSEILLNDAEVHSGFQSMSRIRMSKTVNVGRFGDARRIEGAFELLLQAAVGQGESARPA